MIDSLAHCNTLKMGAKKFELFDTTQKKYHNRGLKLTKKCVQNICVLS